MKGFQRSLLEFLAFLTVLIERTGAARDCLGADGRGTCRSRVRTAAPRRLLDRKFAVKPGGGAPTDPLKWEGGAVPDHKTRHRTGWFAILSFHHLILRTLISERNLEGLQPL